MANSFSPRKPTYDELLAPHKARKPHGADKIIAMAKYFNELFSLPENLVPAAALKESDLDYLAKSPTGPMGLMQLGGAARKETGVTNPFDPEQSLMGGAAYYRHLSDNFKVKPRNLKELSTMYTEGPGAGSKMIRGKIPYSEQARAHYLKLKQGIAKLGLTDHLISLADGPVKKNPMEITIIGGNGIYDPESLTSILMDYGIKDEGDLKKKNYMDLPPKAQGILDRFKELYPEPKDSVVELTEENDSIQEILDKLYKYDLASEQLVPTRRFDY